MIRFEFSRHPRSHQGVYDKAIRQGFAALDVDLNAHNFCVCWGWRGGLKARRSGYNVLVMERGYLGDRFAYTSIAWNGLNGNATFPNYPADNGERFRACGFKLKPRKEGGDYVLIIGQVTTDMAVRDVSIQDWEKRTALAARETTGLPVVYRPHPQDVARGRVRGIKGIPVDTSDLHNALAGAALVVTYSSNTAVDALIAGVPTVAMSRGSMAYGVAATSLDDVVKWDSRERWAHALAWKQWTLDEIASGYALRGVIDGR